MGLAGKGWLQLLFSSDIALLLFATGSQEKRKEGERKRFRKISNRFQTFLNLDLIQSNL
jgi:hypothetical protein